MRTVARGNLTWPSWSHDGKTLALGVEYSRPADPSVGVLLISTNDQTGEIGAPVRVDIPRPVTHWDDIGWTHDDRYVLLNTNSATLNRGQLWRIARDGKSSPVNLVPQEPGAFWEFMKSRDGKKVVYVADLPARHTIWRVDLPR